MTLPQSSSQSCFLLNGEAKMKRSRFFTFSLVLMTMVFLSPRLVLACSGVPYPILELFVKDSSDDYIRPAIANYTGDPNASCEGGTNPTTRLYILDEGATMTFQALWNTLGSFTIQYSDNNVQSLVDQIQSLTADWWNGPDLLPMDQVSLLAGSNTAIPAFSLGMSDHRQGLVYSTSADLAAGDPMKQMCICVSPVSGYSSANGDWQAPDSSIGLINSAPTGYPIPSGTPLTNVFDGGSANLPLPTCFRDQMTVESANFDDDVNVNPNVLDWLPHEGSPAFDSTVSGTPTADDTRVVVADAKWDTSLDPKWTFSTMGVQWNWDATGVVKTNNPGTISGLSGEISCSFPVPSEPFFIECRVTCLMLFNLENAQYVWYEVEQEYDGVGWSPDPATLPTIDYDYDGDGVTDFSKIDVDACDALDYEVNECRYRAYGLFLRGSESGASQSTTLVCVRDTSPPKKILYKDSPGSDNYSSTPPVLQGRTGDLLAEGLNDNHSQSNLSDNLIPISVVDNNPFNGFAYLYKAVDGALGDRSCFASLDPGYLAEADALDYSYYLNNLGLKIYYTTELYDYCRAGNSGEDSRDRPFNLEYNFFRPKVVWAQAAVPSLDNSAFEDFNRGNGGNITDELESLPTTGVDRFNPSELELMSDSVEVDIYAEDGSNITEEIINRMNLSDIHRLSPLSAGQKKPAFSVCTFYIPVAAFKEPLPLHLSRDKNNRRPGRLFWYPYVYDSAGNAAPTDLSEPADTQDPTVSGSDADDIKASFSFDEASGDFIDAVKDYTSPSDFGNALADSNMDCVSNLSVSGGLPAGAAVGKAGEIEVFDDEPPQVFLYVVDTKYSMSDSDDRPLTYRFGAQLEGDALRTAIMDTDGWCADAQHSGDINIASPSNSSSFFSALDDTVGTLRAYDLIPRFTRDSPSANLDGTIARNHSYEPTEELEFSEMPFSDYDDYFNNKGDLDPSAEFPQSMPGCWVDEDSRLLFHVVAFDNCFTYFDDNPSFGDERPASLLQAKLTSDFERNGIANLDWEVCDEGNVHPSSDAFEREYIFRNPNVDDSFNPISGKDCYVLVRATDYAGNSRAVKVHFYVQSNQMRFRSLEEERRGWKLW